MKCDRSIAPAFGNIDDFSMDPLHKMDNVGEPLCDKSTRFLYSCQLKELENATINWKIWFLGIYIERHDA